MTREGKQKLTLILFVDEGTSAKKYVWSQVLGKLRKLFCSGSLNKNVMLD